MPGPGPRRPLLPRISPARAQASPGECGVGRGGAAPISLGTREGKLFSEP